MKDELIEKYVLVSDNNIVKDSKLDAKQYWLDNGKLEAHKEWKLELHLVITDI